MKPKTLYNVNLSSDDKTLFLSILGQYKSIDGFSKFCDALSNSINGKVTKQNLIDMCDCVVLIGDQTASNNDDLSYKFDIILEAVCDDVYKKYVKL
jgi:hypothetical protein